MALSSDTLSTELRDLVPTDSEATAISRLVASYAIYFEGATVAGASLVVDSTAAGEAAMGAAMVGISAANQGATKLAAGVSAFWTAQLALPTSMWVTAPIVLVPPITPPGGLATLSAALTAVFASNTSSGLSLEDACDAIAAVIHSASTGATVLGSVPPATPAAIPIL